VIASGSVAHYTLLAPLGAGGMGIVYRARDTRLDREVALKLLPTGAETDPRAVERFKREARAASALSHPNIVGVFEVGEAETGWFIAMELVHGSTLGAGRGTPWPIARAIDVLRQCALALAVAHDAGIVHRDIKPDNVMVRDDGYVKLLDFGLARLGLDKRNTDSSALSEPGMLVGTMGYVSPEQACGEPVGPPTDVFSLGILAWELLVGEHPFAAPTQLATMGAIITRDPKGPARLRPELPPALDVLVRAMLAKAPAARPTATAVAEVLRELGGSGGLAAVPARDTILGAIPAAEPSTGGASATRGRLARRSGIVVGRARDVAHIVGAYADVQRDQGTLLCIAGEPGIGKTTLVETALAELAAGDEPPIVARGRCSERLAGTEAYLPFMDALEAALEHDGTGAVRTLLVRTAPSWATLLGHADATPEESAGALASQERLKREMAALLAQASRRAPVVLFLDDLHWADASTVDLIAYLGARLDRMRLMLLVTFRDAELRAAQHPFLQVQRELATRGQARELDIALLSEGDVADYIGRTYAGNSFPAGFARAVHARTEGNPLFVADVLRWLGTQGVIAEEGGRWTLVRPLEEVHREIPGSVRSMIERKIAQLEDADRKVLAAAAVQGADFDAATVAAVLKVDAADVEEQLMVLDKVYAFARRVDDVTLPDGTPTVRYRFVHALYQNQLVLDLAPSRRAAWSTAAADRLEAAHGARAPEIAAELAALREAGREPARAAQWYGVAAQRAMGVFAYDEAGALAQRGLAQVTLVGDPAMAAGLELPLRLVLGASNLVRRGFAAPETAGHMHRARALCDAMGELPALAPALWVLVLFTIASGQLADAAELAAQLLQIGRASGDPVLHAVGHVVHVGLNTHRGHPAEGFAHADAAEALVTPAVDAALRARFQPDPLLTMRCEVVRQLWVTGRADEAVPIVERLVARATQHGDPQGAAFVAIFAAELAYVRGDLAAAERIGRDALALCEEHGIASERLWNTLILGAVRAAQGARTEGIAMMRGAADMMLGIGCTVTTPFFLGLLAQGCLADGDVAGAQGAVARGLDVAERTGEHMWDALLWRVQGAILARDPAARGDALGVADCDARADQAVATTGTVAFAGVFAPGSAKTAG
jgi:hypothetical protein